MKDFEIKYTVTESFSEVNKGSRITEITLGEYDEQMAKKAIGSEVGVPSEHIKILKSTEV
ncbi:hypothetical protein [Salimicrobium halophilum]|uniref:Uncharacterized protein n=1 Tax=Salimicrobium halophilum TaxID=86666 RepID=A0A1G8WE68_9BACI|nr:hypothetical protein [Salimicrobium halophilum]SDJ75985.1 hypothetical protein SAMN04490247_3115 [Salimicrobium halophilum]